MHIGQALDLASRYDSLRNPLTSLGDYLDPELISRCLAESGSLRSSAMPTIHQTIISRGRRRLRSITVPDSEGNER